MKKSLLEWFGAGAAIILTTIVVSCDTPTRTPTPPAHYGLEIGLLSATERKAPINQNLYVSGHFYSPQGDPQRGAKVSFLLDPPGLANITPFAYTEPDSPRGFNTDVTFTGRSEGVVLIYASVLDGNGQEMATDTLHISVESANW